MIPKAIPMQIRHIAFLLVFFILYVIFGGLVFMLLESPDEQIKRKEIASILSDFSEHIKQLNHPNITEQYIKMMMRQLLMAQNNNLVDEDGQQKPYINWSFINSFFFSITVITTIGYGHLTPNTIFGKVFCIIYALFGIPITSLLIGSIADRFSKLYSPKEILRAKQRYQRQLSARIHLLKKGLISLVPWFFVFLIIPAFIFIFIENWVFLDGFYYCFITLSTIGFGDFVAGAFETKYKWFYMVIVVFWIVFGLAYLSMVLNFITQSLRSSHISSVVHSLRHRISSNPSLANRLMRQQNIHAGQFKRQQSSPIVLCEQDMYKNSPKNLNNNYINPCSGNVLKFNPDGKVSSTCLDIEPNRKSDHRKIKFFRLIKSLRNSNKIVPRKSSKRNAFNDAFGSNMRHANSLPELAARYTEACCSSELDKPKMGHKLSMV